MKKFIASLLCAAMVVTLFAGCSKSSSGTSDGTASGGASGDGGNIVRYTLTTTPQIDPGVGADLGAATVLINIYDPLVMPKKDGSVEPWIAKDWKVSDDGKTWTFTIRDDVKFHSGNPLTAGDVAYTMQRLLDMGEGFGYLFNSTIEEVRAIDDTTVEFVCNKTAGTLLATLVRLYILDSKLVEENYGQGDYGDKGDYGKAFLLENDAGSGPYKVKEYAANSHVLCEQNTDYWNELDPNAPKEFRAIGSNEAVTVKTMMERKELELTDKYQTSETINSLGKVDGIDIMETNTGDIMYLLLNNSKAPTDDPHVRKALAYMMDYDVVCNDIFPNSKKADSIISQTSLGHKKMNDYSFDIEKAKEEIAQSKYADNITDYPIEVCWVAETPDREKLALLIQAAADQIGVKVNVVKTPWASVIENSSSPESTANATTTGFAADYPEAGGVFDSALSSKKAGTWMNCCWINDDKLDGMIDEALSTIDTDERVAKYEAIQDYLADQCVMIPLAEETLRFAYQSSYVDYNAADPEYSIPVMGYVNYMPNIRIYPDKK
ncbi:MAG: ABC transporter substrate-binding protein [Dorea sp.]|nr:ABC transporter substrate-binding protein [Dorea sp.]